VTELLLLLAGFVGGCLNTLAGGGSFVVFPALLYIGVPPVLANASNTYAAFPGYLSGAVGFLPTILQHRDKLLVYSLCSLVFGWLGAELLLRVSNASFTLAVPWLMLFAVLLFAFGGRINTFVSRRAGGGGKMKAAGAAALLTLLAATCLYGGFFNAGLGILLLAVLALTGLTDIHAMNGLKLWISTLVALVAVARFAMNGSIDWYHGTIALIGATIGGYVAARVAQRVPTPLLRTLVLIYGVGITAYFFWKTYLA
jgi:uncharacterized membrane protein YfcA